MKRVAIATVVLALVTSAFAQQAPASQNPPATQPSTAQPGMGLPTQAQTLPTPGQTAPPAGKRPPQAKTQPEFDAYKAAQAITEPVASEKAADEFATKYPDSELRILLYQHTMQIYSATNSGDKIIEMGRKVLALDPNQPEALVGIAEQLAQRTRDTDLDKDQRWAEAEKDAQLAIDSIDTDLIIPAGTPQANVDTFKGILRSTAYSILGTLKFSKEKYADAELNFRKALDALPSQPDPVVVLRLAIALDRQAKYPEALQQANRAVELTQADTMAGKLARQERDRLAQLTGGSIAPAAKPAGTPNPAPPARNPGN